MALWRNPRRFNVAVSRAKALLAVVGHPAVLVEDPCWKELVRHCVVHGTFRGAGAAAVRSLVGVREAPGGPMSTPSMQLEGGNGEGDGRADSGDLSATIEQLAELALLGLGNAHRLFPETLEQEYEAYAEETEWRVML